MAKKTNKQILTPYDILGGPKRTSLNRKQWLIMIGVLSLVLVIVNSYFLFMPDSKIDRIYYLNEYEWQNKNNYKHFLPKQSVVASKEIIYVTANASELDQIKVKKGQMINSNDPLAVYNEATREQLVRQTAAELNAYNSELDGLNSALEEIERQATTRKPSSYINADQFADNINVQVQMEIVQSDTSSEANAILMQHIAEVERKIEITRATLDELNKTKSIPSPINGSIGDIIFADNSVTFEIHSSEKNIIAYLSEQQLREVKIGQSVIVEVQGHDEPVEGVIIEVQEFPAKQSVWIQRLTQKGDIQHDETVYEIRIDLNDLFVLAPYNSLAKADITIQEVNDSYISPSHWIVNKEIEGVSDQHIYTVDYDGKIRLEPVTVLHEAPVNRWNPIADELVDDIASKEKLAQHHINHVKSIVKNSENEPQIITAFMMNSNDPSILLSSKDRRIQAATFPPLPLRLISFDEVGKITWKDVVKYLFY